MMSNDDKRMVFIDTEVGVSSQKVQDYGAVRDDGAVLHTHSEKEFADFVAGCSTVCGHNILDFDLRFLHLTLNCRFIDTLHLSPLLFPRKPYHRLVKDEKLQVDELNNPVNDAMKARDLFYSEVEAWRGLDFTLQTIYHRLLANTREFSGFFEWLKEMPQPSGEIFSDSRLAYLKFDGGSAPTDELIRTVFRDKICASANLSAVIKHYPIELAYALAVIGTDDPHSITPPWVLRNYPKINNVMAFLRNTPCGVCSYCQHKLDAHVGLQEYFGYNEFRTFDGEPMQQRAVEAAINGESILTIFPTGGGKSLTFQLPALMAGSNIHGLTVVISPLQSLMKDQVDNLVDRGVDSTTKCNAVVQR